MFLHFLSSTLPPTWGYMVISQKKENNNDIRKRPRFDKKETLKDSAHLKVLQKQWCDGVMIIHLNTAVDHREWTILFNAFLVGRPVLPALHSTTLHHSCIIHTAANQPQWYSILYRNFCHEFGRLATLLKLCCRITEQSPRRLLLFGHLAHEDWKADVKNTLSAFTGMLEENPLATALHKAAQYH